MTWFGVFCLMSVIVHVVLFGAMVDIYFTSPLIPPQPGIVPSMGSKQPAAFDRLVLILADGLRADSLFDNSSPGASRGKAIAPYLHSLIAAKKTLWGVSHTRVPTESRPGHIALIGGFYEDISALLTGWKQNVVPFDHVFNRTRETWAWGSPDIVPLFVPIDRERRATSTYHTAMYDESNENFASDATELDKWVFKRVDKFFTTATSDKKPMLRERLQESNLAFFLHLLGVDTTGHSKKPQSIEYAQNIQVVDSGVKDLTLLIDSYYGNDGRTAYLFTSDHGMLDWGAHGTGEIAETRTPLLFWSGGKNDVTLAKDDEVSSKESEYPVDVDDESHGWGLSAKQRVDVAQADVAVLMSCVLKQSVPTHSIGRLPIKFLSRYAVFRTADGRRYLSHCLVDNARQLNAQHKLLHDEHLARHHDSFIRPFIPYDAIADPNEIDGVIDDYLDEFMSGRMNDDVFVMRLNLLIDRLLSAKEYYFRYDHVFLYAITVLAYLAWFAYVIAQMVAIDVWNAHNITQEVNASTLYHRVFHGVLFAVLIISWVALYTWLSPAKYYVYVATVIVLVALTSHTWRRSAQAAIKTTDGRFIAVISVLCLLLMTIVGAFHDRRYLSLTIVLTTVWITVWMRSRYNDISSRGNYIFMVIAGVALTPYCLLPPILNQHQFNVNYVSWLVVLVLLLWERCNKNVFHKCQCHNIETDFHRYSAGTSIILKLLPTCRRVVSVQLVIFVLALGVKYQTLFYSMTDDELVPLYCVVFSWLVLLSVIVGPLLTCRGNFRVRFVSLYTASATLIFLTGLYYEGLFFATFYVFLRCWTSLMTTSSTAMKEDAVDRRGRAVQSDSDVLLISYLAILFNIAAILCSGNTASIVSFDIVAVYCFVTAFKPFLILFLSVCKFGVIVLCASFAMQYVITANRLRMASFFIRLTLLSDILSLSFFFRIRTDGSWREIGTSLSHYICTICFGIGVIVFLNVATLISNFTLRPCGSSTSNRSACNSISASPSSSYSGHSSPSHPETARKRKTAMTYRVDINAR